MMRSIALIGILTGVATGVPALACSGYDVDVEQAGSNTYDPARVIPLTGQIRLVVRGPLPDASCVSLPVEVDSLLSDVREFGSGPFRLTGSIPTSTAGLATVGSTIVLTAAGRSQLVTTGSVQFDTMGFTPAQFVPPGHYITEYVVGVAGAETDREMITFSVPASVKLVGDSASGAGQIEFGELRTGAIRTANFFYQTNANIAVTAMSDNGGKLVHERGLSFGAIDYSARIGSRLIATDGSGQVKLIPLSSAPQTGTLSVVLGTVMNPYAGRYNDVLTLTFRAF